MDSLKAIARDHFKWILRSIDPDARKLQSRHAAERLIQTPEFVNSDVVMIFLSMSDEILTSHVAVSAWEAGKSVVVPQIYLEERKLSPVKIRSLGDSARTWNEVFADCLPMPISEIDLVLVPALAYSKDGYRLGRGLGFYDRFLVDRDFRAVACGFGFEVQFTETLPIEDHDVRLKMLVTDRSVHRFS